MSFGMVLRDEWGSLLAAGVRRLGVNWTPAMAEAGAARFGMEVVSSLGYENVVLECDALSVVRAIVDRKMGAAPIFLLFEEYLMLALRFQILIVSMLSDQVIQLLILLLGGKL